MIDEDTLIGDNEYGLDDVKEDFYHVLSKSVNEIAGLRQALVDGRIDGNVYEGDCACLKGTIANIRGCHYHNLGIKCSPFMPAEEFFLLINTGDTPETNEYSALAVQWIDEFVAGIK